MGATTGTTLITNAMIEARIIHPDETIPTGKSTHALGKLNDMLESWALDKILVPYDTVESFALTIGTAEYTYGSGGTFNSARPLSVKDECFMRVSGYDYPCELKTVDYYRGITDKSVSERPTILAVLFSYPLARVYLYPTPDTADSLYLKVTKSLITFAAVSTSVDLMPGYKRLIELGLALELCASYGKDPSAILVANFTAAMALIRKTNTPMVDPMVSDLADMVGGGSSASILEGPF